MPQIGFLQGKSYFDIRRLSGVFAPDVEDEDSGDEDEGANEDRHGTNFNARRVVSVEAPHTSSGGRGATGCGGAGGGGCPALSHYTTG